MWGSFEISESYVGERVYKISFVGSIKREIRFRLSVRTFWRKGRKTTEERRDQGELRFLQIKVRVSLAFQFY